MSIISIIINFTELKPTIRVGINKNGMKVRKLIYAFAIAAAFVVATPDLFAAPQKNWEPLKSERVDAKQIIKEQEIEIRTAKGLIIASTTRPTQIKVFTILGQLVSNETLPAGTSQLSIPGHGIYIVKIGSLTCKVAL